MENKCILEPKVDTDQVNHLDYIFIHMHMFSFGITRKHSSDDVKSRLGQRHDFQDFRQFFFI